MADNIISPEKLTKHAQTWHDQQLTVVLTNGCFDLLHAGHLRTFIEAKKLGDILVVGLNSDRSVQSLKGPSRPLINQDERALLVSALRPVDFVTIFDENNAMALLEKVRPSIYVKGGDYSMEILPERDILLRLNSEVVFIPLVEGVSTTELVHKIKKANF